MDRPALDVGRRVLALVDRLADHVPQAAEGSPTGTVIGCPVSSISSPREAVRGVHRDGADTVVAEMLLHLGDQLAAVGGDAERAVDRGQRSGKTASRTTPLISTIVPTLELFFWL